MGFNYSEIISMPEIGIEGYLNAYAELVDTKDIREKTYKIKRK